jgi:predicted secreted protein
MADSLEQEDNPMDVKLGLDAKLYRNTGSYETPEWEEVENVRDLTLNVEGGEADVTTRKNGGWKAVVPTLKEGSIEFEMVWDTDDEDFEAIRAAYFDRTNIEFAVMDGDITVAGSQGLRATMVIIKFNREEKLDDALKASVTAKPTLAENAPEWMEVSAPPAP